MMLRYFAILAVVMASCAWAEEAPTGMDTVSSGDKLHLSYVPHVQSRLFGMPGSTARIQVRAFLVLHRLAAKLRVTMKTWPCEG